MGGEKSCAASVLPKKEKELMLDKVVVRKLVRNEKEPVPTRSAPQDPLQRPRVGWNCYLDNNKNRCHGFCAGILGGQTQRTDKLATKGGTTGKEEHMVMVLGGEVDSQAHRNKKCGGHERRE